MVDDTNQDFSFGGGGGGLFFIVAVVVLVMCVFYRARY